MAITRKCNLELTAVKFAVQEVLRLGDNLKVAIVELLMVIWTEHNQITQDACSAFCNGSHMRDFDIVSAFFFRYSRSATWKPAAKCTKLFQGLDEFGVISHGPQHNHFHSLRSFGCQFLAGLTYLVQRIAAWNYFVQSFFRNLRRLDFFYIPRLHFRSGSRRRNIRLFW